MWININRFKSNFLGKLKFAMKYLEACKNKENSDFVNIDERRCKVFSWSKFLARIYLNEVISMIAIIIIPTVLVLFKIEIKNIWIIVLLVMIILIFIPLIIVLFSESKIRDV